MRRTHTLLLLGLLAGCPGIIEPSGQPPPLPPESPPRAAEGAGSTLGVGASGLRRLTRAEYDATLRDLLGDTTRSGFSQLPEDSADPFDNDFRTQQASGALVETLETLATSAA